MSQMLPPNTNISMGDNFGAVSSTSNFASSDCNFASSVVVVSTSNVASSDCLDCSYSGNRRPMSTTWLYAKLISDINSFSAGRRNTVSTIFLRSS